MDYVSGGELSGYVRITQGLQTYPARFFASEVALALLYLHGLNIIHRDLKPENVLLDSEGHVKIADFGFAKVVKVRTYTFCGTAMYMAPEIITGAGHGKAADWWAFGVFVFELLTGTTPFVGRRQEVYWQACQDEVRFPSRMADDERDLIGSLMTRDPSRRLGSGRACSEASAVKMHSWFNSLDWDLVLQKYYPPPLVPWERILD
jgi:serine/threonine protein kinase